MYYVVRTHSQTDRQTLWKVCSRGIVEYHSALAMKRFLEQQETNKKHRYFIVTVDEEQSNEAL